MIRLGFWRKGSHELRWLVLHEGQIIAAYPTRSQAEAHHG